MSMLDVLGQKEGLFDLYASDYEVGSHTLNQYEDGYDETIKKKVLQSEKEWM